MVTCTKDNIGNWYRRTGYFRGPFSIWIKNAIVNIVHTVMVEGSASEMHEELFCEAVLTAFHEVRVDECQCTSACVVMPNKYAHQNCKLYLHKLCSLTLALLIL